ncbi:MAG: NAD kinase [Bacteroidales bacterium]|nr:NAD kinase [Bacteroidales bacterium]MCF8327657.1 NAD kinase [Bacteroidales bacterium]
MNIAIYGEQFDTEHKDIFRQFIEKLEANNIRIYVYQKFYDQIKPYGFFSGEPVYQFMNYEEVYDHADILISAGGDGTLLNAITLVRDSGIPILGLNFGRLGFLSSISKENVIPAINHLLNNNFEIEERALLNVQCSNNIFGDLNFGLNDLTIHRHNSHALIVLDVYVNDQFLNSYWADGLIISTPTGSTGYSLSCGGPILTPESSNFIITPIATHNLTVRPIVLPDSSTITVKLNGRGKAYTAALDSRVHQVAVSDVFTIKKESFKMKLVKMPEENFFNTIRDKLNWGLDNRN